MQYIDPTKLNPTLPQNNGMYGISPDGRPLYQPLDSSAPPALGMSAGNTGLMAGISPNASPSQENALGQYFQSLSPQQQQERLAVMRSLNPGVADNVIRYFDAGAGFSGQGSYTNLLNHPLSAWETAHPPTDNTGSFWTEAGRPLVAAGGTALATGGSSILGQVAGSMSQPNNPNAGAVGQTGPNYQPYTGASMPNGLFDNLLGTVGNLSPAILAGYLGNSQRQDVMGQVGKINDVASGLSGPAFMQSITNPYDLQTGQGRTALSQSLQQRGVGGSSFGNQQLGNFDYQRGLGRGDLATRAGTAVAGTQGQLYSDALRGIVGGNAAYNSLLGAGLGASGSLFNQGQGNPLASLLGGAGGLAGVGGSIGNALGGLFGTGVDSTTNPYPSSNPGGQVDFGNDPSLGTSGNGLFDWLGQNGGSDLGLNF